MPDWSFEDRYTGTVVGIDEAGRGPWAGPVVAGAVVFLTHQIDPYLLEHLNDSKKLSAHQREKLYTVLEQEQANGHVLFAVGQAEASEIDHMNILQATFEAMRRAVQSLPVRPDMALIDGNRTPSPFLCPVQTIIRGDSISLSVSAGSIVAKVFRDRLMADLAKIYPEYGFEKNAGYGTKQHQEALAKYGSTPQHRKTYRPIATLLAKS